MLLPNNQCNHSRSIEIVSRIREKPKINDYWRQCRNPGGVKFEPNLAVGVGPVAGCRIGSSTSDRGVAAPFQPSIEWLSCPASFAVIEHDVCEVLGNPLFIGRRIFVKSGPIDV